MICEPTKPYTNEIVTITVRPNSGYELETLTVERVDDNQPSGATMMLQRGTPIEVTVGTNGTFTFKMPPAPVTVNATFMQNIITGVDNLNINQQRCLTRYNLMGQPVRDDYKGIVIENGVKKIMR